MNAAAVAHSRLRLLRNAFRPRGRSASRRRPNPAASVLLLGAFASLVYLTMATTFAPLAGAGPDGGGRVLALILAAAVAGLLVFDVHFAVSAVLLDSDLELLRRAPIPRAALLLIKLVDSLPRTASIVLAFAGPAVLAYAGAWPLPIWSWPLAAIQLAALWALPLGLGVTFALLLLRRVPARRAREALGLLATFFITGVWLVNSFVVPRLVEHTDALGASLERWGAGAAFSPPHWAARALAAAAADRPLEAIGLTLGLALAGAVALALAAMTATAQLDTVLARIAQGETPRSRRAGATAPGRARPTDERGGMFAAVIRKDARMLARDWTVLSDVLAAAALWTLLPLVSVPLQSFPAEVIARAMMVALAVALGYEVAARTVPFERDGLVWMRLAPVRPVRWAAAKLAGAGMLSLALMAVAATGVVLALGVGSGWPGFVSLALSALALSLAMGFWTGIVFGDPKWTNPRAMLHFSGRLIATLLLLVQAGLWLGLTAAIEGFAHLLPPGIEVWAPPLVALPAAAIPLTAAIARLRSPGWPPL